MNKLLVIFTCLLTLSFGLHAQGTSASLSASANEYKRIVIGGKAVIFPADAVYLFPEAKDKVIAIGGADQGLGSFLTLIDPSYAQKPVLDKAANAEVYASLKPDLVLSKVSNKAALASNLETLGIKSIFLNLESPEDYYKEIALLGTVFNNETRAKEVISYYKDRAAKVEALVSKIETKNKKKVLIVQASLKSGESFEVPPDSWIQTSMIKMAGGIPAYLGTNLGSAWTKITYENIAAMKADVIIVVNYKGESISVVNTLNADPRFQALKTKIIAFKQDYYSWDQPDTRWTLGLAWLAAELNPSLFKAYDSSADAKEFYTKLYGMSEKTFTDNILPKLK